MSNVSVQPPNLKEVEPKALAIADFLRHHKDLKQRQAILNGKRQDFFRVKRAVRALQSDDYAKAQKKNKNLPELNSRNDALEAFRLLPLNKLAFRVSKMETEEAKKHGLKPVKGIPVVQVVSQQEFGDEMYYTWFYEPVPIITYVYAGLALLAIFAIVCFPLWPMKMRLGVWYLSMGMVGVLCAFFVLAIIRLILFIITYFVASPGIWIFPNLFEDVGFVDSFIPLWNWSGTDNLPKANAPKKKKKKNTGLQPGETGGGAAAATATAGAAGTAQGSSGGEQSERAKETENVAQSLLKAKMSQVTVNVKRRKQEIMESDKAPQTEEETRQLEKSLFNEEMASVKKELLEMRAGLTQGKTSGADLAQSLTSGAEQRGAEQQPVKRNVTLEDANEEEE